MNKRDIRKLAFAAYNLRTEDTEVRSTKNFLKWFEDAYKLKGRNRFIAPRMIENVVFEYFETSAYFVYRKCREEPWMYYRQLIQYLMWKHSKLSQRKIGSRTGGKIWNFNRATVICNIKVIANYYNTDFSKRTEIDKIEVQLKI